MEAVLMLDSASMTQDLCTSPHYKRMGMDARQKMFFISLSSSLMAMNVKTAMPNVKFINGLAIKVHSIIASLVEVPLTGTERRLSTLLGLEVIDLRGLDFIGWGFYAHFPLSRGLDVMDGACLRPLDPSDSRISLFFDLRRGCTWHRS